MRSGRAFTLLETAFAAVIGAIIVLVVIGMMASIERTDRLLAARAEQSGDLQRARIVMQRVCGNFLMSSKLPPRPADQGTDAKQPAARASRREADRAQSPISPRIILDADPAYSGALMSRSDGSGDRFTVQRFEVVVSDPPVPSTERDAWSMIRAGVPMRRADREARARERLAEKPADRDEQASGTAALRAALFEEEAQGMVRAVRGSIEFHPQGRRAAQGRLEDLKRVSGETFETPTLWEMWWVPLPPRGDTIEDEPPPAALAGPDEPYLIASNIRFARFTAFDDREKKLRFAAARRQELPAYIELEIETGAGLSVHWMFETSGASGPEVPPRPAALDSSGKAVPEGSPTPGSTPSAPKDKGVSK
jgi:type II secretory pathway component PulJ